MHFFTSCSFKILVLAVTFVGCLSGRSQPRSTQTTAQRVQPSVITTNRPVRLTSPQTFSSSNEVYASNDFPGARLDDFRQTGPTNFSIAIKPENFPINDSAWFAFKIWSKSNQTVSITLNYENGRHRYRPKISSDGLNWQLIANEHLQRTATNAMTLTLAVSNRPVFVCGQELFTSRDFDRWMDRLSQKKFVRAKTIGHSVRGKAIRKLEITEAGKNADVLLIIGRQHPPEVTGTFALQAFLNEICSEGALAKRFRARFLTVVIPLMNPDGVDSGHWRHNANGVDLNRDWGQFNQRETQVARDEFLRLADRHGKIRFGIDFHSTQHDVFYPFYDSNSENAALLDAWLAGIQSRAPDYDVRIEPSRNRYDSVTLVSVAWMNRQFGIPAVTYEVGDETDRETIKKVAIAAANSLMELLLKDTK